MNLCTKNYENPSIFVKVTAKNQCHLFFLDTVYIYNDRPIVSHTWSIDLRHFSMTLNDPDPTFKVTPIFDAEYLDHGTRYGHSYNTRLIGTRMRSIKLCHFQLTWITPNLDVFYAQLTGDLFAIAKFLVVYRPNCCEYAYCMCACLLRHRTGRVIWWSLYNLYLRWTFSWHCHVDNNTLHDDQAQQRDSDAIYKNTEWIFTRDARTHARTAGAPARTSNIRRWIMPWTSV